MSQITTPMTTTAFRIPLIVSCMGMRFTSHNKRPTTASVTTRLTSGILSSRIQLLKLIEVRGHCNGAQICSVPCSLLCPTWRPPPRAAGSQEGQVSCGLLEVSNYKRGLKEHSSSGSSLQIGREDTELHCSHREPLKGLPQIRH